MNKIKINTPKVSLINNIGTSPTFPRIYTIEIADSGANIYLENKVTPTISHSYFQRTRYQGY